MFTKMLVPLDGSKTAEKVLPCTRALARRLEIPVELLGVIDVSEFTTQLSSKKARSLDRLMAEREHNSRVYLEETARGFLGLNVKCTVERGNPEEAIIQHGTRDPNTLIAMATHGRSGVRRWLLGSIAEKVLRGGKNPLLLVRAKEPVKVDSEAAINSIIVPLDGSGLAESVLPVVIEWAKVLHLKVIPFRAYELPAAAYYGRETYLPDYEGMKNQFRTRAGEYLEAKAKALAAEGLDTVASVLVEGEGADEIIAYTRKTPDALLAMCSHGRSGVRRWMLGSVTEKVVRHSSNPVLVVRGGG